jgi:hypothetical protein
METSVAGVTARVAVPLMAPLMAVIVVEPTATLVARPPAAIVAVAGVPDAQVALPVRF